jgi:hypothetical protein
MSKKRKFKVKKAKLTIFPGSVSIVRTGSLSPKQLIKLFHQCGIRGLSGLEVSPFDTDCSEARTYCFENFPIIVVRTNCRDLSVLTHELGHAVHSILDSLGVDDEETFCYMQGWLFKQFEGWMTDE